MKAKSKSELAANAGISLNTLRAWCNDYYSRDSAGFKFAPDFIFLYLEHGDPHPLLDEGGILVNWKTNFVPEMVEIDKYNGTEWETVTLR